MSNFDVCVIGAGLIGSATAKYLGSNGARTCLIGPSQSIKQEKREIFDSWSDISRVTHTLFGDPIWAYLAIESIKRYRQIEEESGIKCFTDTGYLVLSDSSAYIKENEDIGRQVGVDYFESFDGKIELEKRFSFLQFKGHEKIQGVFESKNSGFINPIKLVEAQRILFTKKYGGTLIDDVVIRIEKSSTGIFNVHLRNGTTIRANKVVVCAGAFVGHHKLLPDQCKLDITYRPALVCRLLVDHYRVRDMPPLIFVMNTQNSSNESTTLGSSIYSIPPILYPDGHTYLKFGYLDESSAFENRLFSTSEAIDGIYRPNATDMTMMNASGQKLVEIAKRIFKDIKIDDYFIDTCCWIQTPTKRPYIGSVAPDWFVVTGDNGFAAKSSDEIGRLATDKILKDMWTCDFIKEEQVCVKFMQQ